MVYKKEYIGNALTNMITYPKDAANDNRLHDILNIHIS